MESLSGLRLAKLGCSGAALLLTMVL